VPQSNVGSILIGVPVINDLDVGGAIYDGELIEAKIFMGGPVLEPGTPTGRVETVKKLLSPLSNKKISTILGLLSNHRISSI
jgi:hypothetical protein